jgi:molybdenum cofactor biosynthesis enzyme MoaA
MKGWLKNISGSGKRHLYKDAKSGFDISNDIDQGNLSRSEDISNFVCKAPFSNMFFDVNGKVHACCLSWKCSEEIQNNSIDRIWKGEKFNLLRNKIIEKDLSFACNICNSQIKNNNSHLALSNMFNGFAKFNTEYPVMMEFELSNTCNLECIMCNKNFSSSIRKNRDKLPPVKIPYDDDFILQVEKYIPYLEKARFVGGEPFLTELYYKIWDRIIVINPQITISVGTNGTILNDRIKKLLEKGKFEIVFSIDSLIKNNYEMIRKNADFDTVINNLDFFRDYCLRKGTFFNIAVCPMQQNWTELPGLVKYCNEKDVDIFFNTVIEPFECALWPLSGEKLDEIRVYLEKQNISECHGKTESHNITRYNELINQIKTWKEKSLIRERNIGNHDNAESGKSRFIFEKKIKDFINNNEDHSFKDKNQKIDCFINKIDKISGELPVYIDRDYLFSILNGMDIKSVADRLINSSIESLVNDAKSMMTNHFYTNEL